MRKKSLLFIIKKNWRSIFTIITVFVDFVIFNVSFYIAIYLRFQNFEEPFEYWKTWIFINVVFLIFMIALGVYRSAFLCSMKEQKSLLRRFSIYLALVTMSYIFLIKGHEYSRGAIIMFILTQYLLLMIARTSLNCFKQFLAKWEFGKKNILIVEADYSAKKFFDRLREFYGQYYNVKGFIANGTSIKTELSLSTFIIGEFQDSDKLIQEHNIEQVFIVSDYMSQQRYRSIRKAGEKHGIEVKMISPYIRDLMQQSKVKDVTGVPLTLDRQHQRRRQWQKRLKRIVDLIFLLPTLPILILLGVIITILIKLTSKGQVFFKQKRSLYKGGPVFLFYKFRTMYEDAERHKKKYLEQNESNGALFKIKSDPRVTPIGRFLRKYSLDEIPQFINVLKGEMNIVGPRPLPVRDFEMIKKDEREIDYDWYKKRGRAKPGITGLWQISGRSDLTFEEMCLLDLYYIENQSLFFDLEIMFETIPVILLRKGAY